MPNIPEFHFKTPTRKIERVVKPKYDYKTIDRLIDHVLDNKKMSNYQLSIHDTNKDGQITINEILEFIISTNSLNIVSVTPSIDEEVAQYRKASPSGSHKTGYGESGGGGGGL
tara:strand:- start:399 stop:737 length:339 start_codon:yes stop_codon:yes gene_type:complete